MIMTISPLVKGARTQWWRSMGLYVLGSAIGGLLFFGSLGVLGEGVGQWVSPIVRWAVVGVGAIALCPRDFGQLNCTLPARQRGVPKSWWARFGPNKGAFAYGLVLGTGVSARVPFTSFYVVALWALMFGHAGYAGVLGIVYGISRAIPVIMAGGAPGRVAERWRAHEAVTHLTRKITRWREFTSIVNGAAVAGFGGVALTMAVITVWR